MDLYFTQIHLLPQIILTLIPFFTCLSCSSNFFSSSTSAFKYSISAFCFAIISSLVNLRWRGRPLLFLRVSSKLNTPLSLYAFLYLALAQSTQRISIISTSNPASSKITLEVLPLLYKKRTYIDEGTEKVPFGIKDLKNFF